MNVIKVIQAFLLYVAVRPRKGIAYAILAFAAGWPKHLLTSSQSWKSMLYRAKYIFLCLPVQIKYLVLQKELYLNTSSVKLNY